MWVRFCFWLLVVILTLGKQMILAMDLMAIGMFQRPATASTVTTISVN